MTTAMGNSGGKSGGDVSDDVKTFVDAKIAGNKLVIFSKSYCPYCTRAKKMAKEHVPGDITDDDIDVIEIEDRADCDEIQRYLKSLTGASSVPRVFVNGKSVGGSDDMTGVHKSGELARMLKSG